VLRNTKWIGALVAVALTSACQGNAPRTPTLTSDDVLSTAQAIAQLTRNAPTDTATPVPETPTATVPPPTAEPTITPTPNFPAVTAKYPVSVRSGPGEEYEILDLFLEGQTAQIVGRYDLSPIGTWYLITRIGQGLNGWVWSGATDVSGDLATVPVLEPPPPEDDD
jgi:SH3-like domain-containing protein